MDSKQIQGDLPCDKCGSSHANTLYDDGHYFCHKCSTFIPPLLKETVSEERVGIIPVGKSFTTIPGRGFTKETAERYGVLSNVVSNNGTAEHVYPYFDKSNKHIANKLRKSNKAFQCEGDFGRTVLFGQQAFPPGSAKSITIVEGECDAMAAFQMNGGKYPVVSIKGAGSAVKDCTTSYEYLNSFSDIVLCFDNDKDKEKNVGQDAAKAVAGLFPIGKVRIVTLREGKDANDYLLAGKEKAFISEWWSAPTYTPEGLRLGSSLWDDIIKETEYETVSYPWVGLDKATYGLRLSEFVLITADRKIGKTSLIKEITNHIYHNSTRGIGLMLIEETNRDTAVGLMSVEASKRLHLPDVYKSVDKEELRKYYDAAVNSDRIVIWDHFGSHAIQEILNKIRHMHALGCKYIILDHLSIVVSNQSGDERKQLDEISTELKTLCMELNICVIAVIHQSRSGQIRGSAGPEQLANIVIKLYRDMLDQNEFRRNVTKVMVEANRFSGDTGPVSWLYYSRDTGRMVELTQEQIDQYEAGSTKVEIWT